MAVSFVGLGLFFSAGSVLGQENYRGFRTPTLEPSKETTPAITLQFSKEPNPPQPLMPRPVVSNPPPEWRAPIATARPQPAAAPMLAPAAASPKSGSTTPLFPAVTKAPALVTAPGTGPSTPAPVMLPSRVTGSNLVTAPTPLPPRTGSTLQFDGPNPKPAAQPTAPTNVIQRVGFQGSVIQDRLGAEDAPEYQISLEPPGPQRLFRLESEAMLQERMRQEARERPTPERIQFPEEPIISRETYRRRTFPAVVASVEPNYLLHRRLLFEEINSERYGWDLGPVGPFVSAGAFYLDVALLPYNLTKYPLQRFDSNSGLCLPGDPVPYMLYPPGASVTGTLVEAGTIVALFAIFP